MHQLVSGGTECTRRQNQDRTVDSICKRCGVTIGRAFGTDILEKLEARHVCQPAERRRAVRIAYRIFDDYNKRLWWANH